MLILSMFERRNCIMPSEPTAAQTPPVFSQEHWKSRLAELSPAYFGLVMATGIVSLGAMLMDKPTIAQGLFLLNIVQYSILCVLYLLRAC